MTTAICAAGHEYVRGNGCDACKNLRRAELRRKPGRAEIEAEYEAKRRTSPSRIAYQRAWYEAHKDEIRARVAARPRPPPKTYERACRVCGEAFVARDKRSTLCGKSKCRRADARRKAAKRHAARRLAEVGRTHEERVCAECGESFIVAVAGPERGRGALPECCSPRCTSRRARRQGSHYRGVNVSTAERKRIYLRDGCRCQLCGGKVRIDLPPLNPLAPTLDHIIPRAEWKRRWPDGRPGMDSPSNLQLAHRKCNSDKRAGGEGRRGAQTLLFG
jgi:5-methylcytosine-specific restriction endonuclease McrA